MLEAEIILLLISADFNNSEYIWKEELAAATERHERGTARVVPVIVRKMRMERNALCQTAGLTKKLRGPSLTSLIKMMHRLLLLPASAYYWWTICYSKSNSIPALVSTIG